MTTAFNDLPGEILTKIINFVWSSVGTYDFFRGKHITFFISRDPTFIQLRLVSKRFHYAVTPIVFSSFYARMDAPSTKHEFPGLIEAVEQTRATFESGNATIFYHVKRLEIITRRSFGSQRPWFELFQALLPIMINVYNVEWDHQLPSSDPNDDRVRGSYPDGVIENMLQSVGALPKLKELHLRFSGVGANPATDVHLEPVAALSTLEVIWDHTHSPDPGTLPQISALLARCPEIKIFSFNARYPGPKPFGLKNDRFIRLEQLFEETSSLSTTLRLRSLELKGVIVSSFEWRGCMPHFRFLETLIMRLDPSTQAAINIGEVLIALSEQQIYLREIDIDALHHPAVIDYLSSYSGLEKLAMRPRFLLDNSVELVHRFFSTVLSRHANSLKSLRIGCNIPTAWSRVGGAEQLSQLASCQQLEHLFYWVSVTAEDVAVDHAHILVSSQFMDGATSNS
ncbi:hypothetical protein NP233_g4033 [Leucocoprinus birnbaumii]|uniref:Uncharacterized protein n=1 Tax=Leucocoprinus birnbaumii TaxID=56174 RepID=A0AAD5YXI5_9AGAR|nr:hypothetical protein NP233_g4033 [Leucocoprinus birnbaumii]